MEIRHLSVKPVLDEASVLAAPMELTTAFEAAVHVSDETVEHLGHLALRPIEFFQIEVDPSPAPGTNELLLSPELTDRALGFVAAFRAGYRDRSAVKQARHVPSSVGGCASVQSEPR